MYWYNAANMMDTGPGGMLLKIERITGTNWMKRTETNETSIDISAETMKNDYVQS